jgi:hypothetical protein
MTLRRRLARALSVAVIGFCSAYLLPDACRLAHGLVPIRAVQVPLEQVQQDLAVWQSNLMLLGTALGLASLSHAAATRPTPATDDELERTLLTWPSGDTWTVRHALESTIALGATGSGKSSTTGRVIATAMLEEGWGGLFLTAKPSDRETYESYCRDAGRSKDVVIVDERAKERFNPLAQEADEGCPGGVTLNVVHLLSTILEAADPNAGDSAGREEDGYWRKASTQLLRNAVDLMLLAEEPLTMVNLYHLVISAPTSKEHLKSEAWRKASYCLHLLERADELVGSRSAKEDFSLVTDYFVGEWPELSEKTRSVVLSTFTSSVDVLNRGMLRDLLCSDTTVTPRACEDGKLIIVDLPVKRYGVTGRVAQLTWKYAWQKSIERRSIATSPKPVFLFADECQSFVTSQDAAFLATARSSRAATVYLTQNLGGLEAALGGGPKGEAAMKALLGNLNTKILHANSDSATNSWAAEMVGKAALTLTSSGFSRPDQLTLGTLMGTENPGQVNVGTNQTMDFRIQPADFSTFSTGGPANNGVVEALLMQNGRAFASTGLPFTFVQFHQV